MYPDWKIDYLEKGYVNTHIQVAHLRFPNFEFLHYDQLKQVAFWATVVPVLEEVHPFHCVSRLSANSLLSHWGAEGSCRFDFHELLLCVIPSQPWPAHAKANQLPISSVLGLWLDVGWTGIAFPSLWCMKPLLWPFRPYSTQGACQTVLAIPDLLA